MRRIFCNYLCLDIIPVEFSGEYIHGDRQRQINDQLMTIQPSKEEERRRKRKKEQNLENNVTRSDSSKQPNI